MDVEILGVPVDLGADRRGVDMGPSAIRYAGLTAGITSAGHTVTDLGDVPTLVADGGDVGSSRAKYLKQILGMARSAADGVKEIITRGNFPLVLGGDHSASLGSVAGAAAGRNIGLIWLDAHGDFNTPETTPSGNVHGMILSALAGIGEESMVQIDGRTPIIQPGSISLVGVRELDAEEKVTLRSSGVNVFTMTDIDRRGMAAVMEEAIAKASAGTDGIHVSFDLDALDPVHAPGVGTPVPGGLSYREAQLAMELVSASGQMVSMDAVEVNPILDDHNRTGALAVDLILSGMGKSIF